MSKGLWLLLVVVGVLAIIAASAAWGGRSRDVPSNGISDPASTPASPATPANNP
jgi:hypothetical protein